MVKMTSENKIKFKSGFGTLLIDKKNLVTENSTDTIKSVPSYTRNTQGKGQVQSEMPKIFLVKVEYRDLPTMKEWNKKVELTHSDIEQIKDLYNEADWVARHGCLPYDFEWNFRRKFRDSQKLLKKLEGLE
jgi:hypothetical protein